MTMATEKDSNTTEREVHTYPDGSQRVGKAPFPKLSPLEEQGGVNQPATAPGMHIPQGVKTSGAEAPQEGSQVTESEFRQRVEQQVRADVASGKSPDTPNPTTASDKPELAGTANVVDGKDPANPDDLKALARGVKPGVKATQEQIDAAATQVARETGGLVASDKKARK
jgi:hypothetical protein